MKHIILIFSLILPVFLLGFKPAHAHPAPLTYSPPALSILDAAPAFVAIEFSERIESSISSIKVYAPSGNVISQDNGSTEKGNPHRFRVALGASDEEGPYTVAWQVVSADDGHLTKGSYIFSVGPASGSAGRSAQFQIFHSSGLPEAAGIFFELFGEAVMIGVFIVIIFIWRHLKKRFNFGREEEAILMKRLSLLLIFCFSLVSAGILLYLVYKAGSLSDSNAQGLLANLQAFLSTASAKYSLYRLFLVSAAVAVYFTYRKKIIESSKIIPAEWFIFALLALTVLLRAAVSHAAASNFLPVFSVAVNAGHLFFKDVLIGGLFGLLFVLPPIINRNKSLDLTAFALTTFSKIANIALVLAGGTGVYIVWLHLKDFGNITSTAWGKTFAALTAAAAVILAFRLFHELYVEKYLVKSLKAHEPLPGRIYGKVRLLPATLMLEALFGIIVMAITAQLIITTPPAPADLAPVKTVQSGDVKIEFSPAPYEKDKFLLVFSGSKGRQAEISSASVSLANPEAGIGPLLPPLEKRFEGGYVFPASLLTPPGEWTIDVSGRQNGEYDAVASFRAHYPDDYQDGLNARGFSKPGLFEIILVLAFLSITFCGLKLFKYSSSLNHIVLSSEIHDKTSSIMLVNKEGWVVSLTAFSLIFSSFFGAQAHESLLKSRFQRECEAYSVMNVWHESIPARAGSAVSDAALPGCTVGTGLGQYHFADRREYLYFIRPALSDAFLSTIPPISSIKPGQPVTLKFKLTDNQKLPLRDLTLDHNRILHAVIVSSDMSVFDHIHVEDDSPVTEDMLRQAEFPVSYTFPKAGYYMIAVDYTVRAHPFTQRFYIPVGGVNFENAPKPIIESQLGRAQTASFEGYEVNLKTSRLVAGYDAKLNYTIRRGGETVKDLEPFLAAPMHISLIRSDIQEFKHIHGLLPVTFPDSLLGQSIHTAHLYLPASFGPDIEASGFTFPSPGEYFVFGEFKHKDKVITTKFLLKAE